MLTQVRTGLVLFIGFTLVTGIAYPLAITGIAQGVFPRQANGSLIEREGAVVGSALIGQAFTAEGYFHARPSAVDYDASTSGGSNLGPTSRGLAVDIVARREALGLGNGPAPADAVTASGSGLDPHISPANAAAQVERVAAARGLPADRVAALVAELTESPVLGIFGEPAVNVLKLNIALDELAPDNS